MIPTATMLLVVPATIFMVAILMDYYIKSDGFSDKRAMTIDIWSQMNRRETSGITRQVNRLYLDLFDYIYGPRIFSKRRLVASIITSIFGMVMVTSLLGIDGTFWQASWDQTYDMEWAFPDNFFMRLVFVLSVPFMVNLPADFVSLIETRLVMKLSQKANLFVMFCLILLDFILTTIIFCFGWWLLTVSDGMLFYREEGTEIIDVFLLYLPQLHEYLFMVFLDFDTFNENILDMEFLFIFYVTTFITSAIWLSCALTYLCARLLHAVMPVTDYFLFALGQSKSPALVVATLMNIVFVAAYGLWEIT